MLRAHTADRNAWQLATRDDLGDERRTPPGHPFVRRGRIDVSGHDPVRAVALRSLGLRGAVDARAERHLAGNAARVGDGDGARRELRRVRARGDRDVESLVHDEPASGALLRVAECERDRVDLRGGEVTRAKMHGAARAERGHDAARAGGELGVGEDQVVGDGMDVRDVGGHHPPSRSPASIPRPRIHSSGFTRVRPACCAQLMRR